MTGNLKKRERFLCRMLNSGDDKRRERRAVMVRKFGMTIFLLLMTVIATGCLELDGYAMHYELDKSMRGKLTLIFYGIRSEIRNKKDRAK